MSESNSKTDSNTNKNHHRGAKPEIQRYSVARGKYSSRLNSDRPSSGGNSKNSNHHYQNNSSYYENDYYNYQPRSQRKTPKTKPVENETKKPETPINTKDANNSENESVNKFFMKKIKMKYGVFFSKDLEKRIETMTFENQNLSEQKSTNESRAGLIYLNPKEPQQNSNETNSSSRQYYNQSRKKQQQQQNKKDISSNQPQPITQSSRGLTNVTRTLYDPNAPTPKTPPISVIQPTTIAKPSPTSLPPPPPPPPPTSANTQQQMQEFYQQ